MRLFLIFHGRFPSEKAASLFAAKSAEAFAEQGLEVTLVLPKRRGLVSDDAYSYYSVKKIFDIVYLPTVDLFWRFNFGGLAFWLSYIFFSLNCRLYLKRNSLIGDIIYSNEILPLFWSSKIRKNCFYEMHDFPESKIKIFGRFLRRFKWILIHNRWKLEEAKKLFPGISGSRFIFEPNAVDLRDFDISVERDQARSKLGLPLNKKIVVYTGHLYGWKGVHTLAEAAKILPNEYLVLFVGGTVSDINAFREKYGSVKTIRVVGHVQHIEIPFWQKAADILVLPNTAKEKISAFYTSPMKLFEYMASKRTIVATDIPSIREVLNDSNSVIVEADNSKAMARGIITAANMTDTSNRLAEKAFEDVVNHTWQKRAGRIVRFIKTPRSDFEDIAVPKEATKYILFQRTQYLFFRRSRLVQTVIQYIPRRLAYALESLFSNFNLTVSVESFFRRRKVANLLSQEMRIEYNEMKDFLPKEVNSILDIGSGVAGIDIFLYRHYKEQKPRVYLLDKTEMPSKVYYSFRPKGCYYNSLSVSKKLLEENGVPAEDIYLEEARDNLIGFKEKFDLVVSLISWGFHYPVSTYLDQVYDKMNHGGSLIMDIRKVDGDNGLVEVRKKFGSFEIIKETSKNTRIVAHKH